FFTSPPPSALNPPVYPNSRQVTAEERGDGHKVIAFQTKDNFDVVLAFYASALRQDGWVNPLVCTPRASRNCSYPRDVFAWNQGGPDGPTHLAYRLKVSAMSTDTKMTNVLVELVKYDPLEQEPPF